MKKILIPALTLTCVFAISSAFAGPGCGKATMAKDEAKSGCPHAQTAKCDALAKQHLAQVMEAMPVMTYKVGDFTTHCGGTATAKAQEAKQPIHYLVSDSTFDCEEKANAKLAELLEAKVADLMAVAYQAGGESFHCPMTAAKVAESKGCNVEYRVAGFTFESKDKADATAEAVAAAVGKLASAETATAQKPACCAQGDKSATSVSAEANASGCGKSNAKTVSAKSDQSGCPKGKAKTACAKSGKAGCCADKAKTASAKSDASGCCKGKSASTCCPSARVAAAYEKIRVAVETAAKVSTS